MELIYTIYAAVFVAALILADALVSRVFVARTRGAEVNYRLQLLRKSNDNMSTYEQMMRQRRLGDKAGSHLSQNWLSRIYSQSGLTLDRNRMLLYVAAMLVACWLIATFLISGSLARLAFVAIVTPVLLIGVLMYLRSKRIARFLSQLANSLDIIVRSLGAGHPLPSAIALVAKEMPDPIGSEFGLLSDELTYGTPLEDGLVNMTYRVGADELKLLTISMSVQRGTGGNLGEILENLAAVIRERAVIKAKIKAISAEGRITAVIMALFPFGLHAMINKLVPDYFDPVWDSGYGTLAVTAILSIMMLGIIILYRLVKFDF
jgi:tight adherence protein B